MDLCGSWSNGKLTKIPSTEWPTYTAVPSLFFLVLDIQDYHPLAYLIVSPSYLQPVFNVYALILYPSWTVFTVFCLFILKPQIFNSVVFFWCSIDQYFHWQSVLSKPLEVSCRDIQHPYLAWLPFGILRHNHRYQKSKIDCLRFVMCPLLAPVFKGFFFCCSH